MTPRITLQNTPSRKGAIARSVSFDSHGNLLQGALYLPETAATPLPAVVVTGAWTTVKEQMPYSIHDVRIDTQHLHVRGEALVRP